MWGNAGGIFLVCTANVCRSVYGSAILARALAGTSIPIGSAGADTVQGEPACTIVRGLIESEGLPEPPQLASGARELSPDHLSSAGLILTFTVRQRGLVARLVPSSRGRLFTLLEASSLAAAISNRRLDPGGIEEWARLLHLNRPTLATPAEREPAHHWWQFGREPAPIEPWDIADAHSVAEPVHRARLALVAEHCHRLGTILAGADA